MKKQSKIFIKKENPLYIIYKERPGYEDIELINPKKVPLTPEVLRTFEGFEHTSDEEAENICRTSLLFAQVLLEFIAIKNTNVIDNQHVVHLDCENEAPVIEINSSKSKPTKNKAA